MSIINFQYGDFEDISPNWFDWFSLIISLVITALSIYFAYYLGEKTYKRDKKDQNKKTEENILSENKLFSDNLLELKTNIHTQIEFLTEYINEKDFKLKINPALQAKFLQFLNLKVIYQGKSESNTINKLLSTLYAIDNITATLALELTNYIAKFNQFESKFKNYRQAYYKNFYLYSNARAVEIKVEERVKKWRYDENDIFMIEFTKLRTANISSLDGSANHQLIDQNFILPLIELSNKYIPEDHDAIEIHNIANDAHSGYVDMENLTSIHFRIIEKYKELLQETENEIAAYLNL